MYILEFDQLYLLNLKLFKAYGNRKNKEGVKTKLLLLSFHLV